MDSDIIQEIIEKIDSSGVDPNNFFATLVSLDKEAHKTVVGMFKRAAQSMISRLDDKLAAKVKEGGFFEALGAGTLPKVPNITNQGFLKDESKQTEIPEYQESEKPDSLFDNTLDKQIKVEKPPSINRPGQEESSSFFDDIDSVHIESISDDAIDSLFDKLNLDHITEQMADFKDAIAGITIDVGDAAVGGGLMGLITGKLLSVFKIGGAAKASLLAAGPIAALAGGLIWAAVDGVRGFLKADEWGVGKLSGMMGGLLGGLDSGVSGVFKNMGKWALIGAGIGSIVPVVGTVVGGLIGAVVGAILGFIGGENIAKGFDAVIKWGTNYVTGVFTFLQDSFEKLFGWLFNIGDSLNKWFVKFMDPSVDTIDLLKETITGVFRWFKESLFGFFNWFGDYIGVMWTPIIDLLIKFDEFKIKVFSDSLSWIKDKVNTIILGFNSFLERVGGFIEPLVEKVTEVFSFLKEVGAMVFSQVKDGVEPIISKVVDGFTSVFKFAQDAIEAVRKKIAAIPGVGRLFRSDEEKENIELEKRLQEIAKLEERLANAEEDAALGVEGQRRRTGRGRERAQKRAENDVNQLQTQLQELRANQADDFIMQDGKIQKFNEDDMLLGSKDGGAFQKGLKEINESIVSMRDELNNTLLRLVVLEEERDESSQTIINNNQSGGDSSAPAPESRPVFREPSDVINQRGNFWRTQYGF